MAEWSIAAVLKTVDPQGSGGSNPSLSATVFDLENRTRTLSNVGVKLSARECDLIELLRLDGTLTAARIAEMYSISTRQAERLLTSLKKNLDSEL